MKYAVGDRVVYDMPKVSPHPGQRAEDVHPSMRGESYEYVVEKYWTVTGTPSQDRVEITTRRGKQRILSVDDPRMRKANFLERLFRGGRFPAATATPAPKVR